MNLLDWARFGNWIVLVGGVGLTLWVLFALREGADGQHRPFILRITVAASLVAAFRLFGGALDEPLSTVVGTLVAVAVVAAFVLNWRAIAAGRSRRQA